MGSGKGNKYSLLTSKEFGSRKSFVLEHYWLINTGKRDVDVEEQLSAFMEPGDKIATMTNPYQAINVANILKECGTPLSTTIHHTKVGFGFE